MSVSSRNQVIKVSLATTLLAIGATIALVSIAWPAAVFMGVFALFSSGTLFQSQSEKAKLKKLEILKEQMADSQIEDVNANIIEKIFDSVSEKTKKRLESAEIELSDATEAFEFSSGKLYINPFVLTS